jgi:hypothetical protein
MILSLISTIADKPERLRIVRDGLKKAAATLTVNPEAAAVGLRTIIEELVRDVHRVELGDPKGKPLFDMIESLEKKGKIPGRVVSYLHTIRRIGADAAHPRDGHVKPITEMDLLAAVSDLLPVVEWYFCSFEHGPRCASIYAAGANPLQTARAQSNRRSSDERQAYLNHQAAILNDRLEQMVRGGADRYIRRHVKADPKRGVEEQTLKKRFGEGRSFVLLGGAGAGKSMTFCVMAKEFSEQPGKESPDSPLLPVFVPARDLAGCIPGKDAGETPDSCMDMAAGSIRQYLLERLRRPVCHTLDWADPVNDLKSMLDKDRLLLLVEGLDEVVAPSGWNSTVSNAEATDSLKKCIVRQLKQLMGDFQDGLILGVSCRFEDAHFLNILPIPAVVFAPINREEAMHYASGWDRPASVTLEAIADVFEERLGSRPLYLALLCSHLATQQGTDSVDLGSLDELRLLHLEVEGQLAKVYECDPELQRRCLRKLAQRHYERGSLLQQDISQAVSDIVGTGGPDWDALGRAVKNSLTDPKDQQYQFVHLNFRDYWLANGLCSLLGANDNGDTQDLSILDATPKATMVRKLSAGMIVAMDSAGHAAVCRRLAELIRRSPSACSDDRKEGSRAAAALGMLLRVNGYAFIQPDDLVDKCFQRLSAEDLNLSGLDLSASRLRESMLRGADLIHTPLFGV